VRRTGIVVIAIVVLGGIVGLLASRQNELGLDERQVRAESAARAELRTINTEEVAYFSSTGGKYGTIENLISAGLLDHRFAGEVGGFSFEVHLQKEGKDYLATATPVGNEGRYSFRSTSDGVIRYGTGPAGTPTGQPVR
jgi:hypothetical protein